MGEMTTNWFSNLLNGVAPFAMYYRCDQPIKNNENPENLEKNTRVCTVGLGAKYLVFVSSRSVKTRELSFAQFIYFLRKVCLFFNF